MFLVAGLGNPERKFDNTKHNVGFDAVDELIDAYSIPSSGISMKGMYGKGIIAGNRVMVLKPLTYMNLSGQAVKAYVDYYKIDVPTQLIVIYDDVDLNTGQIRIRKKGSGGSHNGMKNIIQMLGRDDFIRIRLGIGPENPLWDLADFVLAPFSKEDRVRVDKAIKEIPDILKCIAVEGIDIAMTKYNKKAAAVDKEDS